MESDSFQSLHNSNAISEPAAVMANPGYLMYSHTLRLTQGLSRGSYQYPTDTHTNTHMRTHSQALCIHEMHASLFDLPYSSLYLTHRKQPLLAYKVELQ